MIILIVLLMLSGRNHIPATIWTYWAGDMPLMVHLCIASWRKCNPGYRIIVLNEHNLERYTNFDFTTLKHANESHQRFSDYVRLVVLSQHGGIWMDATIICQAPLKRILPEGHDMIGFYLDGFTNMCDSKVIESWFIACPKGSHFVRSWKTEFLRTNDFDTIADYINDVEQSTDFQKIDLPHYLCIHISAQKVLQEQRHNLLLYKAEDTAYKYLVDAGWDSARAVESLQHSSYHSLPILKLRGAERHIMVACPDVSLFFPQHPKMQPKSAIPCVIWTYWEGDMPMLTHLCIDSWRKHNPNYEIVVITKATLSKYLENVDIEQLKHANESPARFSDFVRLHVLALHGGIWLDATIICHASFDWLHDLQEKHRFQFLAYRMDTHTQPKWKGVCDVVESSAFACTPSCPIVEAWRDEFMKLNDFDSSEEYIQSVEDRGIDLQNSIATRGYWAIYTSYLAILQTNPEFNNMLYLLEGTETIYRWQFYPAIVDHEEQVRHLLKDRYCTQPLIKLSNWDRSQLLSQEPDVSRLFDP